jgi:hypothetical protein
VVNLKTTVISVEVQVSLVKLVPNKEAHLKKPQMPHKDEQNRFDKKREVQGCVKVPAYADKLF